ncbi:unnamed protein product [Clonostachys rosea]|uniref:F-box domain-containing protein n=1 Tax=Bionectria ochroleuca TaxID=29856 RepID=A0ABY6TZ44_BIOOC|nr:unnamed protein product [Clonostachys rosea]
MSLFALPNELIALILEAFYLPQTSKREFVKLRLVCRKFDDHASCIILRNSSYFELDIGRRRHWRPSIEWMLATKARNHTCGEGVFPFITDAAEYLVKRAPHLTLDTAIVAACRLMVAVNEPRWVVKYLIAKKPDDPLPQSLSCLENYIRKQQGVGRRGKAEEKDPEIFYGMLHLLVACGDKAAVESVMRRRANIDAVDSVACHPVFGDLMRAAIVLDQVAVIRTLLLHGLDPRTVKVAGKQIGTLVYAAEMNREATVRTILNVSSNIKISAQGRLGQTALGWAARRGWTDTVRLLLQSDDIDPNLGSRQLETPMAAAAKEDHADIVRLLLDRGAPEPFPLGGTIWCPWWVALQFNATRVVRLFLDRWGDTIDVNVPFKYGETALGLVASRGFTPLVRMLLDVPGIEPDIIHIVSFTPLARAVLGGHTEVVRLLLHHKVNASHRLNGALLSYIALQRKHTEIFQLLVERAVEIGPCDWHELFQLSQHRVFCVTLLRTFLNIPKFRREKRDDLGRVLWVMAKEGKASAVEELLHYQEVDPNLIIDGTTPLAVAASSDNSNRIIPLLLARQDLDINRADGGGAALMTAVKKSDLETVQALMGAPSLDVNLGGWVRRDHKMKLSLQRGYDYRGYHLSKKVAFKGYSRPGVFADIRTPLLFAAEEGREVTFRILYDHPRTDHYVADGFGRTCLWWAAYGKSVGIVRKILACTADVARIINIRDDEGWSPLHIVANFSNIQMARVLLAPRGIDVNAVTKQEWTPLHLAMVNCNLKLTKLLLDRPEIDTTLRIDDGRTAFDLHEGCECPISYEIAQHMLS